jgi:cobalamin biosynthesis protein CobT
MQSISSAINDVVMSSIKTTISEYMEQFSLVLASKINEDRKAIWTSDSIQEIWGGIASDLVLPLVKESKSKSEKKAKKVLTSDEHCIHVFGKGSKKDEQCESRVSEKSSSGNYCGKHFKQNEKEVSNPKKKESLGECVYINTKGSRKGEECGKNVSPDSKTVSYCKKHINKEEAEEEKVSKPKKKESLGECVYINTKGSRKGEECGKNVSPDSKTVSYCKKHINKEEAEEAEEEEAEEEEAEEEAEEEEEEAEEAEEEAEEEEEEAEEAEEEEAEEEEEEAEAEEEEVEAEEEEEAEEVEVEAEEEEEVEIVEVEAEEEEEVEIVLSKMKGEQFTGMLKYKDLEEKKVYIVHEDDTEVIIGRYSKKKSKPLTKKEKTRVLSLGFKI